MTAATGFQGLSRASGGPRPRGGARAPRCRGRAAAERVAAPRGAEQAGRAGALRVRGGRRADAGLA